MKSQPYPAPFEERVSVGGMVLDDVLGDDHGVVIDDGY
jgi:hypothetical protein